VSRPYLGDRSHRSPGAVAQARRRYQPRGRPRLKRSQVYRGVCWRQKWPAPRVNGWKKCTPGGYWGLWGATPSPGSIGKRPQWVRAQSELSTKILEIRYLLGVATCLDNRVRVTAKPSSWASRAGRAATPGPRSFGRLCQPVVSLVYELLIRHARISEVAS